MSDDTFDPDALSEAEWSPIGRALGDVTVPPAARESAVAAALAVFDELRATGGLRSADDIGTTVIVEEMTSDVAVSAVTKGADVVRLEDRRRRRYRMLTRVAAAVAVLFIGGVAARGLGRSDNDGTAFEAANKTAGDITEVTGLDPASGQLATAQSDSTGPDIAAVSGAQPEAGAVSAPTFAMATTLPPDAGTLDQKTSPTATIGSLNGPAIVDSAIVLPAVESPEALLAYADSLDRTGEPVHSAIATACGNANGTQVGTLVGTVLYQGRTAAVFRLPNGSVTAVDESTCTALVTVSP